MFSRSRFKKFTEVSLEAQNKVERCDWTLGKPMILISKTMGWKQPPDLNTISGDLQSSGKGFVGRKLTPVNSLLLNKIESHLSFLSAAGEHSGTSPLTAEDPNFSGVSDYSEEQGKAKPLHVIFLASSCFPKTQF